MSLRISLAAAAVLIGVGAFAVPASAVMQVIQIPDPNAPQQNADQPPDGLFDKSFGDHWQSQSSQGQSGSSPFHFTMQSGAGASGGYTQTSNPSAYDAAKQAGSEFYQTMPGSTYPYLITH
jgi:hypothetical protein